MLRWVADESKSRWFELGRFGDQGKTGAKEVLELDLGLELNLVRADFGAGCPRSVIKSRRLI